MFGSPSLFGTDDADFDDQGTYVPANLPDPGAFLTETDGAVLVDDAHVAVHELAREVFEARSVYDVTFGYNLATLNLDARHPDAGFRYGESADGRVLRAEFTPTTAFCPQGDSLCVGAFRAWNGLAERHDYAFVRVRVASSHQRAGSINRRLHELEVEHVRDHDLAVAVDPVAGVDDLGDRDDRPCDGGSSQTRPSTGSFAPF